MNWFLKITAWLPQKLVFRLDVSYEGGAKPTRHIKGPAIIVSNHTAVYDYAAMLFLFWTRTLRYQMAELLFRKKVLGRFLKMLGGIRIDRENYDSTGLRTSERILKKGGVVGIFPEGRLPDGDEPRPLPFREGAAWLAITTGAPIIPVYTTGNYFGKGKCPMVIGKPIDVSAIYDGTKTEKENIVAITKIIRDKVIALGKSLERKETVKKARPIGLKYIGYDFVKATAAVAGVPWLRTKIVYASQKARDIKGGGLIICNHSSFLDPIYMMATVWWRRMRFVATKELFDNPFKKWLFTKVFRCICIDRDNVSLDMMREIGDSMKAGELVVVYPEGHVFSEGAAAFKSGMVLMAFRGKCPIIPIYVQRPAHVWNRLRAAVGEPVMVSEGRLPPSMKQIEKISESLARTEQDLAQLCAGKGQRR
ncbi:MAG: 1-acyl-sn-glycerol-3-phosphate acyltransferase [Clostridia bacterium]|nr:1-acyl-sn-glycerol-3-phosphate acyltransferase [Clostridia bacterium]